LFIEELLGAICKLVVGRAGSRPTTFRSPNPLSGRRPLKWFYFLPLNPTAQRVFNRFEGFEDRRRNYL